MHPVPALKPRCRPTLAAWTLGSLLIGCVGSTAPLQSSPVRSASHATTPVASASAVAPARPVDPFALPPKLATEQLPPAQPAALQARSVPPLVALGTPGPKPPKGSHGPSVGEQPPEFLIAPPPAACRPFAQAGGQRAHSCDPALALSLLDQALAVQDAVQRDRRLIALQTCSAFPAGMVSALRADLGPVECADAIAGPALQAAPSPRADIAQVLYGLGLAARLRRSAMDAPSLAPPFERKRVEEFINGPMMAWMKSQATVVEQLSILGAQLSFYARALVAIEAGMADLRVVDAVRGAPIPDVFAKDPELRDAYFGSLEQKLDPRKVRGRDAALVGLRNMAMVGAIDDARVERARGMLSKMFGGRRIDALDALLLTPLPREEPSTAEQRLAAKLPTYYAGLVLAPEQARDPGILRQLIEHGVPLEHRRALQGEQLPEQNRRLLLRFRLVSAQKYWRSVDIDEAVALAASLGAGGASLDRPDTLDLALSLALRGGPEDAAGMMLRAPAVSLGMGNTAALDAIAAAERAGVAGGQAAFDAAIVLQASPPAHYDAEFWRKLAERYRDAAERLLDPAHRSMAQQRRKAAEDVAAASR
jgi:hypothetical protein